MGHREYLRIFKKVKKDFPNARFLKLQFKEGPHKQLQVKKWGPFPWRDLYEGNDINPNLPKIVKKFLGTQESPKTATEEEIMKIIRKERPDATFKLLGLRYGPQDQIQLKYLGKTLKYKGWYDFKDPELPEIISKRLGPPNIRTRTELLEAELASLEIIKDDKENYERLRAQLLANMDDYEEDLRHINDGALAEDREDEEHIHGALAEVREEEDGYEEDLRHIDGAIEEDREEEARFEDIRDDPSSTEEEREEASVELESIREDLEVLETEREDIENRLGLTTQEKIMRLLKKQGLPAAVASLLAALISAVIALAEKLKKMGRALEKAGQDRAALEKKDREALEKQKEALEKQLAALEKQGQNIEALEKQLADLKKKAQDMASKNPGLLNGVISWVGHNLWILMLVLGVLLLRYNGRRNGL